MKISVTNSFNKSVKRLMRSQTWWYKTYSLFRYDLPRFLKNIWTFKKALWNHYWFDHHGTLEFLEIGLTNISNNVEKYGNEIEESRLKKVVAMRKAVELIKNYNQSNYIDMAEKELGDLIFRGWEFEDMEDETGHRRLLDNETDDEREHNRKVYNRADEIEKKEWTELFEILKGQSYSEYQMFLDKSEDKQNAWNNWFDGTGLKGWWD